MRARHARSQSLIADSFLGAKTTDPSWGATSLRPNGAEELLGEEATSVFQPLVKHTPLAPHYFLASKGSVCGNEKVSVAISLQWGPISSGPLWSTSSTLEPMSFSPRQGHASVPFVGQRQVNSPLLGASSFCKSSKIIKAVTSHNILNRSR